MSDQYDDLDLRPWTDCWQCGGDGRIAGCFEDTCCGLDCDPEDPMYCCAPSRCDICEGEGGWPLDHADEDVSQKRVAPVSQISERAPDTAKPADQHDGGTSNRADQGA